MTRTLYPVLKWATFAVCGYECAAGFSRRMPTVSQLCGKRRALAHAAILGLAIHLYYQPRKDLL